MDLGHESFSRATRPRCSALFNKLHLFRFDPQTGPSAQQASDFFATQNILLRTMEPYGLDDCLRMSIGTDEEMAVVKEAFLRLMQPTQSR